MRIAVVNLTAGGLSGGYRKYLQNILPLMAKDERVAALEVYMPAGHSDICKSTALTLHSIPADNMTINKAWLRNELEVRQPDVVFIPSAIWINCGQAPLVTMIQNMEPLVVPFRGNPLKERFKNIARYMANLYTCRKADRVIAISKFVKTYLTEKWRIEPDRIGLVYHGIDLTAQANTDNRATVESLNSLPFVFSAGSIRPARGLEDIIRALAILNRDQTVHLAIAGNVDPGMVSYLNKLNNMAMNSGISKRVHWLRKLNDAEMAWCYSQCSAFIMTSRVEACPNIVLESMANGCVCVSTETHPMPEFFSDSALYYPSKDFSALARQIQSALSMGDAERAAMSLAAKAIASKFSWEVCARKTVDELQRAVERIS